MSIIAWIVLGLGAGPLANMLIPGRRSQGLIRTCVLGVTGVLPGPEYGPAPVSLPADSRLRRRTAMIYQIRESQESVVSYYQEYCSGPRQLHPPKLRGAGQGPDFLLYGAASARVPYTDGR
jgi:hypothetical protein